MKGILERVVERRYGVPVVRHEDGLVVRRWGDGTPAKAVLYYQSESRMVPSLGSRGLDEIYGDCLGGFLASGALKIAISKQNCSPSLYQLEELRQQPEVRDALSLDSDVQYFMDAANVWFYGEKNGMLVAYDSETGDIYPLGSTEEALRHLLDEC